MFHIRETDLAGRIGNLKTNNGTIETPMLLPVIHPVHQEVSIREISTMGFKAVMTNAYITLKHYGDEAVRKGIHSIIDFDGVVMTDSGGYQVLEYGDISVDPLEMASFEEKIGTDIAITLDTPTGIDCSREKAERSVNETLRAAESTILNVNRDQTLWVGPIQGGIYTDLICTSAKRMTKLGFDLLALGSPTEIMKRYNFILLIEMIYAAKKNIPSSKPLHLFGAGHPLTIPIAVAFGCDLFDSASYMLYARDGRYMTEYGTTKLKELSTLPCNCPVCSTHTVKELFFITHNQGPATLATHNLYQLHKEIMNVKQAIRDGRLWDYVGIKCRSHPKLWETFRNLDKYVDFLEDGTPLFKPRAIFFSSKSDHHRPESSRHKNMLKDITIPKHRDILILMFGQEVKPFHNSTISNILENSLGEDFGRIQICLLIPPFGVVPVEISEIYPLSQHVSSSSLSSEPEVRKSLINDILSFTKLHNNFRHILLTKTEGSDGFVDLVQRRLRIDEVIEAKDDVILAEIITTAVQRLLRFNS